MLIPDAVTQFLGHLEAVEMSPGTVRLRAWCLRHFAEHAHTHGVTRITDVSADFLREYLTHLATARTARGRSGLAPDTLAGVSSGLSVFFKYLAARGLLLSDPARDLPPVRKGPALPRALSARQAERVLGRPDTDTTIGLRDRALLELLYSSAVRRAELAAVAVSDLNSASRTMLVHGKGRKDRVVVVGERALLWVNRYLEESRPVLAARRRGRADSTALFLSARGTPLSLGSVTAIAALHVRAAGIEGGAAHVFRHTCATQMLSHGADIVHVQELLGHTHAQTSVLYTHVSPAALREQYTKTHPAAFAVVPAACKHARTRRHVSASGVGLRGRRQAEAPVDTEIMRRSEEYVRHRTPELARSSVERLLVYLARFASFCLERSVLTPAHISTEGIESYQVHLSRRTKRDGKTIALPTRIYELTAVCAFVRWCFARSLILCDPSARITLPRVGHRLTAEFMTREEVERVLGLPDVTGPYGLRDRAILELLYASGMRAGELLGLDLDALNFDEDAISVKASKQGRDRVIPVSARAMKWLYRHVHESRPQFVRAYGTAAVFAGDRGTRLAMPTLHHLCRRYLTLAGITKKQAVHVFRHTCAAHMIENGAGLRTVQEYLGHRSLNSTRVYAHLSVQKLREVHAETHPAELRHRERKRRMQHEKHLEVG